MSQILWMILDMAKEVLRAPASDSKTQDIEQEKEVSGT